MNISDALAATPVSSLDLSRYVQVGPDMSVADTVRAMSTAERSCACVVDGEDLVGIFTQRDVLMRAIGRSRSWDLPVSEEMTRSVRTMPDAGSASDGLAVMNDWWVRSVPVMDSDDHFVGSLSFYVIMSTIAALVAEHLGDPDLEQEARHSLTLVDFTGLHTSSPVIVGLDESVEVAAHQMKNRGIGSVLVVDGRGSLAGVVTEFDLQMKVGCDHADLSTLEVQDVMTPHPVALAARSPISTAIREMARRGFSHVPLLGESGKPVAVASFRDVAAYVEASFHAMD